MLRMRKAVLDSSFHVPHEDRMGNRVERIRFAWERGKMQQPYPTKITRRARVTVHCENADSPAQVGRIRDPISNTGRSRKSSSG